MINWWKKYFKNKNKNEITFNFFINYTINEIKNKNDNVTEKIKIIFIDLQYTITCQFIETKNKLCKFNSHKLLIIKGLYILEKK